MKRWLSVLLLTTVLGLSGCGLIHHSQSEDPQGASDAPIEGGHTHADADNDAFCDGCSASVQTTIDFYSINDLHGKLDDTYANLGVDEMTTYLRNAQTRNPNTVVLSAGDMWQGSAESNFTKGAIITDWMNDLGFAAMAMGNHEFDWGEAYIEQNAAIAEFPFLGINIYDKTTDERVDYCDASVMIETNGVTIGIIGAIGDCYSSIAEEQVEDVYFKVDGELTALVKAESTRLRALGADMIVYTLHDAADSNGDHYDEELSNGYVDLVFEGHSHTEVQERDRHGVWHLQAGGDNARGLSHAEVTLDLLTGEISVRSAKIVGHSAYESMADDPIVDTLLDKYAEELERVTEVLGWNDEYRNSDALANMAAEALYTAGEARWGEDERYAGKIVLGGGYINVRSPYYLPVGEVTYGDIYPLFTFDNPVALCSVTGARLKKQFIESSNYFMYYGEAGESIKENLDLNETYYVVVDTYCANYDFRGMGFLEIVEYYDDEHLFFTRDALAEWIEGGGMGAASPEKTSTIPEILEIGNALADNAETSEKYRVEGKIISIASTIYGNLTIEDADGNQLYIYGTYDTEGYRYDKMTDPPEVGDTVTLEGKVMKYVNAYGAKVEIVNAVVVAE